MTGRTEQEIAADWARARAAKEAAPAAVDRLQADYNALRDRVQAAELDNEVIGRMLARQNARIVAIEKLHAKWRGNPHTGVPLVYVDAIGRALAAGVDREDTEQPQRCDARWPVKPAVRCARTAGHEDRHCNAIARGGPYGDDFLPGSTVWVGDTGQADGSEADDSEHFPWHYTEYGVVCACGAPMRNEHCTAVAGQADEPQRECEAKFGINQTGIVDYPPDHPNPPYVCNLRVGHDGEHAHHSWLVSWGQQ